MRLKQFYNIATKVSGRKKSYYNIQYNAVSNTALLYHWKNNDEAMKSHINLRGKQCSSYWFLWGHDQITLKPQRTSLSDTRSSKLIPANG